jgi:hypothetical protein
VTDLPPRKGPILRYFKGSEESKVWDWADKLLNTSKKKRRCFIGTNDLALKLKKNQKECFAGQSGFFRMVFEASGE